MQKTEIDEAQAEALPVQALDYLRLVERAAECGLDESWVKTELEALGSFVERFDETVILEAEWKAIHAVSEQISKKRFQLSKKNELQEDYTDLESPLMVERRRLKAWAVEQGLIKDQVEEIWTCSYLPPADDKDATKNKLRITAKRVKHFEELLYQNIHAKRDREFAWKYYGLKFDGEMPPEINLARIGFETSGRLESLTIGKGDNKQVIELKGVRNGVSGDNRDGDRSSDINSDNAGDDSQQLKIGGSPAVHQETEKQIDVIELSQRFHALGYEYGEQWNHEAMQQLWLDFNDGEQVAYTAELLDVFAVFLKNLADSGGGPSTQRSPQAGQHETGNRRDDETGEVDIPGILLSFGFTEMPKLSDPDIEQKLDLIGDRIATNLEKCERYKKNAEALCKPLLDSNVNYERVFGEIIKQHAASKLKRVKSGPNAGKISGSKTVIYPRFCVLFRQTGGVWVSDKKAFEEALLKLPPDKKELLGVKVEQTPDYDFAKLKPIMLKEKIELPGIADAPVNETGKFEIKATKGDK